MQKNRDRPLTKNGYVKQDVLKAISGFFIILAIMAAISMVAGIGKGNGGGSSNGGGNTSSGIVGDTTTGNNGSVELPEEELAGVWLLNDTIEWIGEEKTFNVDLFYDGVSYSSIAFSTVYGTGTIPVHNGELMSFDETAVFYWEVSGISTYLEGWQNLECKTIIISSTLASVENGAELLAYLKANGTKQSISESSFITFTIEGVTYYAETGMTWIDWCDSVYNVNDAYTSGVGVYKTGTMFDYVSKTGVISDVLGTDQILANYDYKIFQKFASGDVEEPEEEDELQGTWVFNDELSDIIDADVDFTSNGNTYNSISCSDGGIGLEVYYDATIVREAEGWYSSYKTINITSKLSEVENGEALLTWLKANATKQDATAPTLISFTIDGTTYQAEEGMTWLEWVDSEYNTDNYVINANGSISPEDGYLGGWVAYSNTHVNSADVIVPDRAYYIEPFSSGGAN